MMNKYKLIEKNWQHIVVEDVGITVLHLACSNCNPKKKPRNSVYIQQGSIPRQPNYCPNCGAKMIKSKKLIW